jgi:uncharacterized membrane protein
MSTIGTQLPDQRHADIHRPWGGDAFGRAAERFARFFGTPKFLIGTDPRGGRVDSRQHHRRQLALGRVSGHPSQPVFSTQAAYAAPLILLAATRQADRDKHSEDMRQAQDAVATRHREELARQGERLLEQNTEMTRQIGENTDLTRKVADLTQEVHMRLVGGSAPAK